MTHIGRDAMKAMTKQLSEASFCVVAVMLFLSSNSARADHPPRIAVFQGEGVGPSVDQLLEALESSANRELEIRRISADEIRAGKLSNVDVLVHPGGSGSKQEKLINFEEN